MESELNKNDLIEKNLDLKEIELQIPDNTNTDTVSRSSTIQ